MEQFSGDDLECVFHLSPASLYRLSASFPDPVFIEQREKRYATGNSEAGLLPRPCFLSFRGVYLSYTVC